MTTKSRPDDDTSSSGVGTPIRKASKDTFTQKDTKELGVPLDELRKQNHRYRWWKRNQIIVDLDSTATQPSVFDDSKTLEIYRPPASYENAHRFDPDARWTWREEKNLVRKIDWRIMLWACIMFFCLDLDRSNISQANTDNFLDDLGLSTNDFNLGNTLFRCSFLAAELPSQLISKRLGPDVWIPTQDVILYLSYFYTKTELPIRLAFFWVSNYACDIISAFLATGILQMRGVGGRAGWRYLFLIEAGSLTCAAGIASFFLMPAGPTQTKAWFRPKGWFTDREEIIMVNRVLRDDPSKSDMHNREGLSPKMIWNSLCDWHMWPLYVLGLVHMMPVGPPQTYLTLSLRKLGFNTTEANLLSIPSVVIGIITMLFTSFLSEAIDSRVLATVVLQIWALPLLTDLTVGVLFRRDSGVSIVNAEEWNSTDTMSRTGFPYIHPIQVAWASRNSYSVRTRTVSASVYNMFVQAGAVVYANIYRADDQPLYKRGNRVLIGICSMNIVLYGLVWLFYRTVNKKRDKIWNSWSKERKPSPGGTRVYAETRLFRMGGNRTAAAKGALPPDMLYRRCGQDWIGLFAADMAPALSTNDLALIGVGVGLTTAFIFREQIFGDKKKSVPTTAKKAVADQGDPRDFVAKMIANKKRLAIFYGSQTGTAEEYAIRIAKEAKSRFGLGSLVCDLEEYDFNKLDALPEGCAAIFVMATYGEGEPTDNAVEFMNNINEDDFEFSKGEHRLEGLKYVVFGLGNKTYEHYNKVARDVDEKLTTLGAQRIGERGEGDDDKSMEEDYLEWKEKMWPEFARVMGVEEGAGSDSPDFKVTEVDTHPPEKVYLGELSARALTKTRGIHDAKNPYPAPIQGIRELFAVGGERNCIHAEFNIEGSGITYQHGDHVGLWPSNADVEVDRLLFSLGLGAPDRRTAVIDIESLDPQLAKVPFPVPTTYETVLRHYIDISSVASRQTLGALAKYAPTPEAGTALTALATDKAQYGAIVAGGCLKLAEVLQLVTGNPINSKPTGENTTAWNIPFDVIVSAIPRLQPRYYSISSSPKLHPTSIHVTCVVLKYESEASGRAPSKWVFGVGSNYLLNLKMAAHGEQAPLLSEGGVESVTNPIYAISGPRSSYQGETGYKAPVHVRRSTFRLPTNPKTPVIMIGPGTGVAPFRGFVQERVALARKAIEKNGEDALADWGQISLYYGCRDENEDFLYKDEWPEYQSELKGKFTMRNAFSRSGARKPDGSKIYVQDLLWEDRAAVSEAINEKRGYVYICGDAKNMSKAVEDILIKIFNEAGKNGTEELKTMKERSRLLLDVWS
ncbi:NADPH--cytochrome P450 reductase [Rhizoctonia solani]|uniref:NADPH--cytochrome P450 reductase n=1 Tax=Rhizoctonia solani TaxID=456999 RepID=A0A8H7LNU0_9AGAM|nr:NADPH--cytochrome P450 reductase [Rhizoctonia solani]